MTTSEGASPRGDLRGTLLAHAVALTRELGPEAVSLREVQRRSGVSPAAAYRHYRDRQALLVAVGQRASAEMADLILQAMEGVPAGREPRAAAVERLRAGCLAYLEFAREQPGLFRSLLLTGEALAGLEYPEDASRGAAGLGPFQLLQHSLDELVTHGVLPAARAPWSDVAVWSACHGLAVITLDGPLRLLDATQQRSAATRMLDVVIDGLAAPPPA